MEENRVAQEEEKLALTSIYTKDFLEEVEQDHSERITYQIRFCLGTGGEALAQVRPTTVILTVRLPPGYPSIELPTFELKEAYAEPKWIAADHLAQISEQLGGLFHSTSSSSSAATGDDEHGVVLFEWIEWLKEWLEAAWQKHVSDNTQLKFRFGQEGHGECQSTAKADDSRRLTADDDFAEQEEGDGERVADVSPEIPNLFSVHHSKEPLVDRKSVFVGHVASVSSVDEVQRVKEFLLSNPKIAKATHNILAYRIVRARGPSKGKHGIEGEITLSDYDDDGENAAGGRLLHLLEVCDCRNVVVVVSRWYGGILLGPQRFKDINNVARQLLQDHGYIK